MRHVANENNHENNHENKEKVMASNGTIHTNNHISINGVQTGLGVAQLTPSCTELRMAPKWR